MIILHVVDVVKLDQERIGDGNLSVNKFAALYGFKSDGLIMIINMIVGNGQALANATTGIK